MINRRHGISLHDNLAGSLTIASRCLRLNGITGKKNND